MPEHLDQPAPPTPKDEQMAVVRIALEHLLHQQRQPVEALAHIGVAARQPNLRPTRKRYHRRRRPRASAATTVLSVTGSTPPVTRIREPFANSTSSNPAAGGPAGAG